MKNKIEFEVTPPYPEDKGKTFWGCVMKITDKNNKINFIEDDLFFEVTYPTMEHGGEMGFVKSYTGDSKHKNSDSFIYKIQSMIPIKMVLSTTKEKDLSGLQFELFKWSKFYTS